MIKKITLPFLICLLTLGSCKDDYDTKNNPITYGDTYLSVDITTDKSVYKPGETVRFTLKEKPSGNPKVRYSHLGKVIREEELQGTSWSWITPAEDFKGYMVDIYEVDGKEEKIYHTIAVDVSSDWTKFPRYGFLSSYGDLSKTQIGKNIELLNRYHINGVQFYDWMHDHHRPLAGTVDNPLSQWPDLIGRANYLSTVKSYIDAIHGRGMKAMFYNLAFGALSNAAADGVKEEWYIFKDANRSVKDSHHLDSPFRSSIYLTNPANKEWQNYLIARHNDVYRVFDFDGYHIDQLGNRGAVYDYDGNLLKLEETYAPFIAAMKQSRPDKRLVMNAVSQFGQRYISQKEVDFLYTEVWDESKTFGELANVILENNAYSDNKKQTVLAAYVNYAKSSSSGYVNAPGVLLANAVIFSFGGAHLELGEHYLANEYFPNSNLQMKKELKEALVCYYDFLVAYQNLLRGGGALASFSVQSADNRARFESWPASQGAVAVTGKRFTDKEVIHLLNFSDANSMAWRDTNGTQKEPLAIIGAEIKVTVTRPVKKIWFASPDLNGGAARTLDFTQAENEVGFTLPSLKYWDMLVLEY